MPRTPRADASGLLGGRAVDLALLLVAAVWGSTYLAAKEIVTATTVVAVLALRFLVTSVAMSPMTWRRLRRADRAEIVTGTLLGTILATILTFETYGIAHTSATNAGLIISLTIVMTPLLESLVSRSWLPRPFFAATVVTVVGVALLAAGPGFRAPALGDWLVLVAAAVRAVHVTVIHRSSARRSFDSVTLTYVQMTTAAVVFCAAAPFVGVPPWQVAVHLGVTGWAILLYLALVGTLLAFFVQMWAVRATSPSRVSLLLGTEPLWALAVGVMLAGDRLGVVGACGAALILLGTAWGQQVERRHRERMAALAATSMAVPVADMSGPVDTDPSRSRRSDDVPDEALPPR